MSSDGVGADGVADQDRATPANQAATPRAEVAYPPGADRVALKFLIPNLAAGSIIGKGGAHISEMQVQSQARMQLSRTNEFYPGSIEGQDRVLLISGTTSQLLTALHLVLVRFRSEPSAARVLAARDGSGMTLRLLVHARLCGTLIGKGGVTIRSFNEDSGATFNISPPPSLAGLTERIVRVSGNLDQLMRAVALIVTKLAENPDFHLLTDANLSYPARPYALPGPGPGPSAAIASRGGGGGGPFQPPAAAAAAAAMGAPGPALHHPQAALRPLPSTRPSTSCSSPEPTLASGGGGYGQARAVPGLHYGVVGVPGLTGLHAAASAAAATPPAGPGHAREAAMGRGPAVGGGSSGDLGRAGADGYAAAAGGAAGPTLDAAAGGGQPAPTVMVTMAVPEERVGTVIGKAGAVITQIKDLLGVTIRFSRKGEYLPGTADRACTIAGTPDAVEIARRLIQQKINGAS